MAQRRVALLLVLLVSSLCCVLSLSCTAQYQCTSVSTDYNYVACVNHVCQCVTANGFIGSATSQDKCRCAAPRSVYWDGATPYCISYPVCAATEVAVDRSSILKAKVAQVYKNLIYPTATAIITGQVSVADLFAPNARGRIDPVGTFDTYSTLIEYYYVLASTPGNRVTSIDIVDLFGVGNEVFVRVNIFFEAWPGGAAGAGTYNLTQSGRYLFDSNNLIQSADTIIHNLGQATNPPAVAQPSYLAAICSTLTVNPATCPPSMDPDGYYTDYNDCINFMTSIPFGTFDQSSSNTVSCRFIHMLLTAVDPAVHCPHVGKTGGGKCIDVPYASYFQVSY